MSRLCTFDDFDDCRDDYHSRQQYMGAASNYNGARKKWRSNLSRQCSTYSLSPILSLGIFPSQDGFVLVINREKHIYVSSARDKFYLHLQPFVGHIPKNGH